MLGAMPCSMHYAMSSMLQCLVVRCLCLMAYLCCIICMFSMLCLSPIPLDAQVVCRYDISRLLAMCTYVCMYVCMYVCLLVISVNKHMHGVCVCVCVFACVYVHVYVYICAYVYVHVFVCVYSYVYTCICIRICMYPHIYVCMHCIDCWLCRYKVTHSVCCSLGLYARARVCEVLISKPGVACTYLHTPHGQRNAMPFDREHLHGNISNQMHFDSHCSRKHHMQIHKF
jgi:hypothetical protein